MGALIEGDKDLFAAVKKLRESKKEVASVVDNKIGPQNIANHFGKQYKNLYNQQESRNDMNELLEDICHIDDEQVDLADLITSKLVKEIIQDRIKSNKSDVQQDFNSDCLKNSPDILYAQLALVLKSLLIHGFMPAILLLCAIVPLVKDPSGSLDDSSNYRGIAISSLFLKSGIGSSSCFVGMILDLMNSNLDLRRTAPALCALGQFWKQSTILKGGVL